MGMDEKTIENLKNNIAGYIAKHGMPYDINIKKEFPYYNVMRYVGQNLGLEDRSFGSVMRALGFDYDDEYYKYTDMINELSKFADESNCIDEAKKHRGESAVDRLRTFAQSMGCTPSDYLRLMTPYHYTKGAIKTDYVTETMRLIQEKYPDGDVTGIKEKDPTLYAHLRNIARTTGSSMQDVVDMMGIYANGKTIKKFSNKAFEVDMPLEEIVQGYKRGLESKEIEKLTDNNNLYFKLVKHACVLNCSVQDLCKANDLPTDGMRLGAERLGRIGVDEQTRAKELLDKREEIISRDGLVEPSGGSEKYRFDKMLAQQVLTELSNVREEMNSELL